MYKVKATGWQGYEVCSLDISVGQEYHEGEKLKAAIEWINKKPFKRCIINIADSLQRHNLANTENPYESSIKLGEQWLWRNKKLLDQINIGFEIIHWDSWINDAQFSEALQWIENEYSRNENFNALVSDHMEDFTNRCLGREQSNSIKYLLEEFAVQVLMDQRIGSYVMLYPRNRLDAERMITKSGFARLKFSKRKGPSALAA